jgi:flagellar assembly protein FliH
MTAKAKFTFDADFGARHGTHKTPTAQLAEVIAEAEARGFRNGIESIEKIKADAAQRLAAASEREASSFQRIANTLDTIATGLKTIEARLEAEAVEVAVAVAKKLAPELIVREPFSEIAALAKRCFGDLITAPHVVVRVNDGLYVTVRGKLEEIARARGYEGRLVVLGEPEIEIGDCRIEWADGGMLRDRASTEAMIAEAVGSYVATRRGETTVR